MEVRGAAGDGGDGPRRRQGQRNQQNHDVQPRVVANGLPKHSYWMDVWLFILFHVLLFLFVYLLPW